MLQGLVPGIPTKTDNKVQFLNKDINEHNYDSKIIDFNNIEHQNDLNFTMHQYNCCGGGVVLDEMFHSYYQVGAGYEYYPQDHSQFLHDHYDNDANCFNNFVIQVYNSFGKHSYTAVICDNYVNHDGAVGYYHIGYDNFHDIVQRPMSFTNYGYQLDGQWAHVVYIHGDLQDKVTGYYLYTHSIDDSPHILTPFKLHIQGILQIVRTVTLRMVAISQYNLNVQTTESNNTELAFENYVKDLKAYENHGCSYKDHITNIIDTLLDSSEDTMGYDCISEFAMHTNTSCNNPELDTTKAVHSPSWGPHCPSTTNQHADNRTCSDFNYPDKKVGFINVEATDFSFFGPDREVVKLDSIEKLIKTADTILSTGVPNYQEARIPIESGLNVQAWERYFHDYADKRLLQYIRFGFPLSLIDSHELCNKEAINHFSAIQYPDHVLEYLNKEKALGALLGPVNHPIHDQYHCSPLLTRPKDTNKRHVILNLSHPYGNSVNDHVDKDKFDSVAFALKFPSIDNITQDIVNHKGDTVLFKVDVARAFRNLRVDPADALKLGIRWADAFFVDLSVAFGWKHGSGSFQILSDAIAHIMAKKGVNMHCYIDDYIVVTSRSEAVDQFTTLCDLLHELGLPINGDKLTPPSTRITCLGIDINIDNNTMSIAQDKVDEIYNECLAVSNKTVLSKQAFQSLLGKLIYIQKCVKPSRIFINRILHLFRSNSHSRKIQLTPDFHKDIQWFLEFLPSFNGISYIHKPSVDDSQSSFWMPVLQAWVQYGGVGCMPPLYTAVLTLISQLSTSKCSILL